MKRLNRMISKLIISAVLFAGVFTSCEMPVKNESVTTPAANASDFTEISFRLSEPGSNARTACPDFQWDNYTYEFYVKAPGAEQSQLVIEKSAFARYQNTRKLPKSNAPYQFTLKGYADLNGTSTQILEGNTGDVILTSDAQELIFIMYPVEGSTGGIRIVVTFPEDGTISNVKAAVSSDRTGTSAVKENLTVTQGTGEKVCIFEKTGLQSAVKQYAVFWFYDSQDNLVYRTAESLQILGGKRSDSRLNITQEFYNRRSVTVTLNKNGTSWTDTNVTVTVKDNDGKTYTLVSNNDGTFSGNIAPGTYEVIVVPSGSSEEIHTGIVIDTESTDPSALDKTVELVTVPVVNDKVTVKPEAGVAGTDSDGSLIVPAGKDFTVTVETKPGYKPADATSETPSTGTITVGGKDVSVTENSNGNYEGGPLTFNTPSDASGAQPGIQPENSKFETITYTILYGLKNGAWAAEYSAPVSFTVETCTSVILPGNENVTLSGNTLSGWKINGSSETFTSIPAGTTKNLTLEAVWMSNGNANYTVEIWKEKADSIDASVRANNEITTRTENGTAGTPTAVTADPITGFDEPVISQSTIASDGSSVVTVKYTRKTITLTLKADGGNWSGVTTDKTVSGKYGASVSNTYGNPVREDYEFDGWNSHNGTLPETFPSADAVYTATWKQLKAVFTVKYLTEDTSGNFVPNKLDDTFKGTIGTVATAPNPPAAEDGFTRTIEIAEIKADGSAVVTVKYSRNQITLNFALEDTTSGKWNDGTTGTKTISGKYGCTITGTPVPSPLEDYSFAGWFENNTSVILPGTFPSSGKTYTARWNLEKVSYTIHYTKEGVAWTDHSYPVSGKAAVGSTTAVTLPVEIAGYNGTVTNITLNSDAALNIVEVAYIRKTITYTFDPAGGNWSGSTDSRTASGKYESLITKPGDPAKEGFIFAGWVDTNGNEPGINFGGENKTYYAEWKSYIAGEGQSTFTNLTIQKTADNILQPLTPYNDTWTFVWYNALTLDELGTGSSISITGKGKHSVILLATDSHGTEFTAAIEFEIK